MDKIEELLAKCRAIRKETEVIFAENKQLDETFKFIEKVDHQIAHARRAAARALYEQQEEAARNEARSIDRASKELRAIDRQGERVNGLLNRENSEAGPSGPNRK